MRRVSRSMAIVTFSSLALVLSACGGDGGDDGEGGEGQAGGEIVVNGCNPENPLIPGNTAETCGGNVLDVTTAKLVKYNPEDASPENDIAESIETEDNQNFTVTIKDDYMFSDGTPVTAASFVDAWNYTAYGPNGYQGSYFFEPVEGYADLQCDPEGTVADPEAEDPCEAVPPAAEEMSGLAVVDDTSFTITTTEKVSNLPIRLGYTAFAPMPESFFEDPETFGEQPVSAGPYVVDEFTANQQIVLVRNPEYSGDDPGMVDQITFKIYTDEAAAYQDAVAGNIDIIDNIPTDNLIDDQWLGDFQDRGIEREQGVIQTIGMDPSVDPRLENPDVRKAISMAIDRDTITEEIFAGAATPATGWVSPVVSGYLPDQCGESCVYDPEAAKELLDSAGGFDGELTLTINGDADHGPWAEAACNSIRQALDVECKVTPTVDFATFLTDLGEKKVEGLFRQGWQMDYPSIENFLVPLYSDGASSNYYSFNDPEFQDLTTQAAAAEDLDEANALYQEAELRLAEDMRIVPLWYTTGRVAWSDKVDNVAINAFGVPVYADITVN